MTTPAALRRAMLLGEFLADRADRWKKPPVRVEPALLDALLCKVRRYRHGARSLESMVEMLDPPNDEGPVTSVGLSSADSLRIHIDNGALDPNRIGGAVALSAFAPEDATADATVVGCASEVALRIWKEGATIAFAGFATKESSGAVLERVLKAHLGLGPRPPWLEGASGPCRPAIRWFVRGGDADAQVNATRFSLQLFAAARDSMTW